jgi:hypothetical protein
MGQITRSALLLDREGVLEIVISLLITGILRYLQTAYSWFLSWLAALPPFSEMPVYFYRTAWQ